MFAAASDRPPVAPSLARAPTPRARRGVDMRATSRAPRVAVARAPGARRARARARTPRRRAGDLFDGVFDARDDDDGRPRAAEAAGEDIEDLVAAAEDSPYFNDAFREALAGAQARQRAERAREKEKIDSEVALIMERVKAERAMKAKSAEKKSAEKPAVEEAVEEAAAETAAEAAAETAAEAPASAAAAEVEDSAAAIPSSLDADFVRLLERDLMEMQECSKESISDLTNARERVNQSIANEKRQLARLDILLDRVRREARYLRADALRKNKNK
jgi:hypothetical protein